MNPAVGQAIEIVRLKVSPENVTKFLEGRMKVDEFVHTIAGHIGTELVQLSEDTWLMIIRWRDKESVLAAQKITEQATVISDWLGSTSQFVSFENATVGYVSK
ncbi:MAG: antibiotic biosynthesis monooxygenase [Rhizobacter sp.]|nr:antibiotic biosynthesis monooxygenase [Chlorobiales bacterium]